jgi:hypothetical protein
MTGTEFRNARPMKEPECKSCDEVIQSFDRTLKLLDQTIIKAKKASTRPSRLCHSDRGVRGDVEAGGRRETVGRQKFRPPPRRAFFVLTSFKYSSSKNCASSSEIIPCCRAKAIDFPQIRVSSSFLFTSVSDVAFLLPYS